MIAWSSQGRLATALAVANRQSRRDDVTAFTLSTGAIVLLGLSAGGFYPTTWGWGSLVAAFVAAVCARRQSDLARRERLMLGFGAAFIVWMLATSARPGLLTTAVPTMERAVFYVLVLWSGLLAVRRASITASLAGVWAASVVLSCVGLAMHLFPGASAPNAVEGRLLDQPLGYANAVAILAAIGVVLAVGFAAHADRPAVRTLAASTLVPLVATIVFAQSRGADLALAAGLAAALVAAPSRRLLAATIVTTLPLPVLAAWAGSRSHVGDARAAWPLVVHDGRMVAGLLVLLTASAAAVAHSALRDGGAVRRAGPIGTASLGAAAAVVVLLLFVLVVRGAGALGDRSAYWHAALVDYRAHPLLGSGPGSFADAWVRYRTVSVATLNAHSLYLETLAELGPLGLALIVVLLSMPLTAIAAGRHRHPFTAPAAGAYVAFLVHAGVDWDWQMPAVTVSALICAIALLASARSNESSPTKPVAVAASVAASLAAAAVMGLALVGNIALSRAGSAARTTSWADSIRLAQSAARWQPWSAEPKLILGEAELSAGKPRAARRSFERAVQLAPQNWQVWYELGRVAPARRGLAARSLAALDPLLVMRVRTSTR